MASSLVIVYHRQPYEEHVVKGRVELREHRSPNGIVPALKGFIGRVEQASWIAWKKSPAGRTPGFQRRITINDSYGRYEVVRLPLSSEQVAQFYHVTSKEALWPIINSFPDQYSTRNTDWAMFREVNRLFAESACEEAASGAVVWVHDYNLWLVPAFVRARRPDLRIAFCHHTAFPATDIFNILPWRHEIVDSLLACDLVGFHIPRYARNFAHLAQTTRADVRLQEAEVAPPLRGDGTALAERRAPVALELGGHRVWLDVCPIGTHAELIWRMVREPEQLERVRLIRQEAGVEKIIVSVGRVDYVKGTREQLLAFERLLQRRPEWLRRVKLLLTAVASDPGMRAYRHAQESIEQLVGRINGHFGDVTWQPVMFSSTAMTFSETLCHYRAADIAWITPLRDGLNLVAMEFVAANVEEGGVLVLSEFAGAAVELGDAVMVNPYSLSQMDAAIDTALDMPEAEQRERMSSLDAVVREHDIAHWSAHMEARFAELGAAGFSAAASA